MVCLGAMGASGILLPHAILELIFKVLTRVRRTAFNVYLMDPKLHVICFMDHGGLNSPGTPKIFYSLSSPLIMCALINRDGACLITHKTHTNRDTCMP